MKEFVGLRAKTYNYVLDDGCEAKKAEGTKSFIKRKLRFENYRNYLEATQLDNKIIYPKKSEIIVDNLKKNHKELMKTIN